MTPNLVNKFGAIALMLLSVGASTPAVAQATADNPLQLSPPRTVTLVVADLKKQIEWRSGPTKLNSQTRRVKCGVAI
jgi:hypothetical protein